MQRLVIEANTDQLSRFIDGSINKVEYLEVLSFLREERKEVALVCKIKFKYPHATVEGFPWGRSDEVQVLERGKDGSYTIYYKSKPNWISRKFWKSRGYLSTPYEIRGGVLKLTFLGNAREVKYFLSFINKLHIKYRVDSLTDARFSSNSPLSRLTEKQRNVLITAFNLGYYDIPRRANSSELAKKLGIRNPTFVAHRRKAERLLVSQVLSGL